MFKSLTICIIFIGIVHVFLTLVEEYSSVIKKKEEEMKKNNKSWLDED